MIRLLSVAFFLAAAPAVAVAQSCPYAEPDMGAHTCAAGTDYDPIYKRCMMG